MLGGLLTISFALFILTYYSHGAHLQQGQLQSGYQALADPGLLLDQGQSNGRLLGSSLSALRRRPALCAVLSARFAGAAVQ